MSHAIDEGASRLGIVHSAKSLICSELRCKQIIKNADLANAFRLIECAARVKAEVGRGERINRAVINKVALIVKGGPIADIVRDWEAV